VIIKALLANGVTLRLGSAKLTNVPEADATLHSYEAKIIQDSQVKISTTRTADQMSFEAENVDKELGLTINNVATVLVGAKVICSKVFAESGSAPGHLWESKVLLTGEIASIDNTEEVVSIKIVSDTAPGVAFIASRPVQAKCPLVFKGTACGYVGSLTTCNKLYESAGGCSGRTNTHRFGGVIIKGELPEIINGDVDTTVGNGDRHGPNTTYPDYYSHKMS
jgi:hypothetical protein